MQKVSFLLKIYSKKESIVSVSNQCSLFIFFEASYSLFYLLCFGGALLQTDC